MFDYTANYKKNAASHRRVTQNENNPANLFHIKQKRFSNTLHFSLKRKPISSFRLTACSDFLHLQPSAPSTHREIRLLPTLPKGSLRLPHTSLHPYFPDPAHVGTAASPYAGKSTRSLKNGCQAAPATSPQHALPERQEIPRFQLDFRNL